jgi:hypothetical protein
MPSYSTNKLLSLPTVTGDSGVWGNELNDDTITPVDLMLGGVLGVGLSSTNYTLSATEIQYLTIKLTGALLADIVVYSSCAGFYIVENNTTGAHTVTWQATSSPSGGTPVGSGIVLTQGSRTLLTADLTVGVRRADTGEGIIPSGTPMLFFQAAAPTGWTQVTSYNNYTLRIVSGTGGGVYSSGQAFSSAVAAGTVAGHALTEAENGPHTHTGTTGTESAGHTHSGTTGTESALHTHGYWRSGDQNDNPSYNPGYDKLVNKSGYDTSTGTQSAYHTHSFTTGSVSANHTHTFTSASSGSGSAHSHGFTGSALNINYVDCILCTRN